MSDEIRAVAERLIARTESDVPSVPWLNVSVPKTDILTVARYALAAADRAEAREQRLRDGAALLVAMAETDAHPDAQGGIRPRAVEALAAWSAALSAGPDGPPAGRAEAAEREQRILRRSLELIGWHLEHGSSREVLRNEIMVGLLVESIACTGCSHPKCRISDQAADAWEDQIMADQTQAAAQQLAADLDARDAQIVALREALAPIMAYLEETARMSDTDGCRAGDKLAGVNDTWLLRSDIARLRAALSDQPAVGSGNA